MAGRKLRIQSEENVLLCYNWALISISSEPQKHLSLPELLQNFC